jgi:hypothetical protein
VVVALMLINVSTPKLPTTLVSVCNIAYTYSIQFFNFNQLINRFLLLHCIEADVSSSGIDQIQQAWECNRKSYSADFFQLDPSTVNYRLTLPKPFLRTLKYSIFNYI